MNGSQAPIPLQKMVVLVGAGNAHLVFIKRWRMKPVPGIAVTLVNEAASVPYSAMVPAHISGDYSREEISLDLVRFCRSAGVRLVCEKVTRLDPVGRAVHFANRPPLTYDLVSLGLGSIPTDLIRDGGTSASLVIRPLSQLIDRVAQVEADLQNRPRPFHWVVVGGGASGCELTLTIHNRLRKHPGFRMTVLQANARLLPGFPARSASSFETAFRERGIACRVKTRVTGGTNQKLELATGESVECDAVLWATAGSSPEVIQKSGLSVDQKGFLSVKETLQSQSNPEVFGTGDCVSFVADPTLPRSGVLAVRQGAVLFDNIIAYLQEMPLVPFRPQARCLYLLNAGDGTSVLNYGPIGGKGRWVRRLKDWIDRRWVKSFLPPMMKAASPEESEATGLMRCGGCGSKVSGDILSAVLKRLAPAADSRVLIGALQGEDAAVFRATPEGPVEVQTVDYFRSFTDDPYLFGRVAALHAVSDLYAMNARPFSALAIATLPFARGIIQEAQLFELLSGAQKSLGDLGVTLAGGHTTEGAELALGFAVTGFAEEETLFRKAGLKVGDKLILTKPIGTGALLAAWMRSECRADWYADTVASMLVANRNAAEVLARHGITACTDVTGFGLGGHLLEMVDASQVSVRLFGSRVPLLPGFEEVTRAGIVSTLHGDNAKLACRIEGGDPLPAWLFDPQTSGGLLAGVAAEKAERVVTELIEAGCQHAAIVGEVIGAGEVSVRVVG